MTLNLTPKAPFHFKTQLNIFRLLFLLSVYVGNEHVGLLKCSLCKYFGTRGS